MRNGLRVIYLLLLLAGALILASSTVLAQGRGSGRVEIVTVGGIIDPVNARFVSRAVRKAENKSARLLIIKLDTPGGLDSSMRKIVQSILNARVPTAAYVSPAGARAASAGVFITAAANFAVMAPGTNLGAAHPVGLGQELPETLAEKATNDASAYIRSIAAERNRNAEWLENAVRKSVSASAKEAVELKVVDFIAVDLQDLLQKLHGRTVTIQRAEITLDTQGVKLHSVNMTVLERLLHLVADPNLAFIFLSIGGLGILYEIINPGVVWPGVMGAILLVLAFLGVGSLPFNWAGAALMLLGALLMTAELFLPGFGVLGLSGVASFIVGALILFSPFSAGSPARPDVGVSLWLMSIIGAIVAAMFFIVLQAAVSARKLKPAMAASSLVGQRGLVRTEFAPTGTVQLAGETWSAIVEGGEVPAPGDEVQVVAVEGVYLKVRKEQK